MFFTPQHTPIQKRELIRLVAVQYLIPKRLPYPIRTVSSLKTFSKSFDDLMFVQVTVSPLLSARELGVCREPLMNGINI